MAALKYWIWLSLCLRPGKKLNAVIGRYESPEEVFSLKRRALKKIEELSEDDIKRLEDKDLGKADKICSDCAHMGIRIITYQDSLFPQRLKTIYDSPIVLYIKGKIPDFNEKLVISIVGTRGASYYGLNTASNLGYRLSKSGIYVLSGMALGIDSAATRGAIEADALTGVVLGCGVDICYPRASIDIYEWLSTRGTIISEYPPGTTPDRFRFPARNRIISGISNGVVVAEAPAKSGALITARLALDQGRDVFAVPGNIDLDSCVGTNLLITAGEAKPIVSVNDIVSEYKWQYGSVIDENEALKPLNAREKRFSLGERKTASQVPAKERPVIKVAELEVPYKATPKGDDEAEEKIIAALNNKEKKKAIDDVINETGLSAQLVAIKITLLELKGIIERSGNMLILR